MILIRATGTCAIVLLHVILCVGPLSRLSDRWIPLLYNRRHLGVSMALIALSHAMLTVVYYHAGSSINPLVSLLVNTTRDGVGFELFGLMALIIIFVMAATSHDFWLHTLSPRVWKSMHMAIYPAYGLLILHVGLGAIAQTKSLMGFALLALGVSIVTSLHLLAGTREWRRDLAGAPSGADWIDIGPPSEIPVDRAKIICLKNAERVAVFRYEGMVSAVSNVCEHQSGPLGEGKIIDGCITCPWHGYQYRPEDGRSPPPYTEKIATYEVRIEGGRVRVNPKARPKGTRVEPARLTEKGSS